MKLGVYALVLLVYLFGIGLARAELLKETDPQLKKELTPTRINQKVRMNLYYQGTEANYLIFYDFKRDSIYLQYRIDQWDYDKNHIPQKLNRGLLYQIEFNYLGEVNSLRKNMRQFLQKEKTTLNQEKAAPQEQKTDGDNTIVSPLERSKRLSIGSFISFGYTFLDRLIY